MDSVDTEKEGIGLGLMKLWGLTNMHLRKWILNLLTVAQHIPINKKALCMSFDGGEILPCKNFGIVADSN